MLTTTLNKYTFLFFLLNFFLSPFLGAGTILFDSSLYFSISQFHNSQKFLCGLRNYFIIFMYGLQCFPILCCNIRDFQGSCKEKLVGHALKGTGIRCLYQTERRVGVSIWWAPWHEHAHVIPLGYRGYGVLTLDYRGLRIHGQRCPSKTI